MSTSIYNMQQLVIRHQRRDIRCHFNAFVLTEKTTNIKDQVKIKTTDHSNTAKCACLTQSRKTRPCPPQVCPVVAVPTPGVPCSGYIFI